MTKAVLLNTTGQLETTLVLPVVALRPVPHFSDAVRAGAELGEVDTYTDSGKSTLLYTKIVNRSSGLITGASLVDYTRQVALTELITRSNGRIVGVQVIEGLLIINLRLNFSSNQTLITMYGAGYA